MLRNLSTSFLLISIFLLIIRFFNPSYSLIVTNVCDKRNRIGVYTAASNRTPQCGIYMEKSVFFFNVRCLVSQTHRCQILYNLSASNTAFSLVCLIFAPVIKKYYYEHFVLPLNVSKIEYLHK